LESILEILKAKKPKNILIITGKSSYLKSIFYETIKKNILEYKITFWNYKYFYPDFEILKEFLEKKNQDYDFIISYGGGTIIDVAKLISLNIKHNNFNDIFRQDLSIENPIFHLSIPTTFGSGAESTSFAVLYKNKIKFSIKNSSILPDEIILDSKTTLTLNYKNASCSAIDAFCQSIESLWAKNITLQSRRYSIKALRLIYPTILKLNKLSESDRDNLLLGSNYAGKAINITKTTAPHAFSYYLTAIHNICHGEAVSILFDKFIDINFDYISISSQEEIFDIFDVKSKNEFIVRYQFLRKNLNLLEGINQIKNLKVDDYIASINEERLSNNPVKININKFIYDSII
tara:strand:+ start:243 stop:1283 length:1041 start_codon:yes stop_codon:yes gene_type:complete